MAARAGFAIRYTTARAMPVCAALPAVLRREPEMAGRGDHEKRRAIALADEIARARKVLLQIYLTKMWN